MPFADSFPVRAKGPFTDLCFAYVHADIGGSGVATMDDSRTSSGFVVTRTANAGEYTLKFPNCRFCLPIGDVRLDDYDDRLDVRKVAIEKNIDPTTGTVNFSTIAPADTVVDDGSGNIDSITLGDVADPASGSEIVFIVLLGY